MGVSSGPQVSLRLACLIEKFRHRTPSTMKSPDDALEGSGIWDLLIGPHNTFAESMRPFGAMDSFDVSLA